MALTYHFNRLPESRQASDYADLARRFGISRARITKIMSSLLMTIEEQEGGADQLDYLSAELEISSESRYRQERTIADLC